MTKAHRLGYARRMGASGRTLPEVVRALCVMALVFLNFGHAPLAAPLSAAPALSAVADASFCGDPLDDQHQDHAPCHACRIGGGADLPPAPCAVEPAHGLVLPVRYAPDRHAIVLRAGWRASAQRAPPALA
jgi:hypothetical protein